MSLRPYDTVLGTKYTKDHPLWPLVKSGPNKGKPSTVLLPSHKKALGDKINLVPNLTYITGVLSSFGSFSAGAEWGSKMAVDCMCEAGTNNPDMLRREVRKAMDSPTKRGGEMHDEMEQHLKGVPIKDLRLAQTVDQVLKMMGATKEECQTEAEYITDQYGFTLDFVDRLHPVIIDWKTVEDKKWYTNKGGSRKPKPSEALQLAVIQDTLERRHGVRYRCANAYIGRESSTLVALVEWPASLCDFMARDVMPTALRAYKLAEECKLRVGEINKRKK